MIKKLWWAWSEMGVTSLVTGLKNWLYLKKELMEWTNFLHAGANSVKLKSNLIDFWVDVVKIVYGHLVHGTLKSAEWVHELTWFFACWLWCCNVRPTLYSISSTFICQFTAVLLVEPIVVAGRIRLSISASWHLSGCFLEFGSLGFSEFWHVVRNP